MDISPRAGFRPYGKHGAAKAQSVVDADPSHGIYDWSNISTVSATAIIVGTPGDDSLVGGIGNDLLDGAAGNDRLDGGAGDDMLMGGLGADTLIGGTGSDTATYRNATASVFVDLMSGGQTGEAAGDRYTSVENVEGTSYSDTIYGDAGNNILSGQDGNDFLFGNYGDDTLYGNEGGDRLLGADGNDRLFGGAGSDSLDGGGGNDYLEGGDGSDSLFSSAGADRFDGGAGQDILYFAYAKQGVVMSLATGGTGGEAAGDTYTGIEDIIGSSYGDSLTGDANNNAINGWDGNDSLYGLAGDDRLEGGKGIDTLYGGDGDDTLVGGQGNDVLRGGGGHDSFGFHSELSLSGNVDRIEDFTVGEDKIQLDSAVFDLAAGALDPHAFTWGSRATTPDQHILYDGNTGNLFFDADGSGAEAPLLFATLTPHLDLSANDFLVV